MQKNYEKNRIFTRSKKGVIMITREIRSKPMKKFCKFLLTISILLVMVAGCGVITGCLITAIQAKALLQKIVAVTLVKATP